MFAFIQEDTGPDDEGVVAAKFGNTWLPLIGADVERVKSLKLLAEGLVTFSKKPIVLAKFSVRTDLETISPEQDKQNPGE